MIIQDHQEFIKTITKTEDYNILAIDVGLKIIGLAYHNHLTKINLPIKSIPASNNTTLHNQLNQVIQHYNIHGIILGLPLNMNGLLERKNALMIENFLTKIQKLIQHLPLTLYDERFTTKLANNKMKAIGIKRKVRNQNDNSIAANIILENFIEKYLK